jgi:hypothetical protein
VISPIGSHDTDVRENADAVLDYIIEPALKGAWTDVARLKRKILEATFLADHPDIPLRIV